jgi:hypothetical protein
MMEAEQLKQCRTCREWKDAATDFTWHGEAARFPCPDCKRCRQAAMRARYHSDPVYRAACRKANRESAARRRAAERGGE